MKTMFARAFRNRFNRVGAVGVAALAVSGAASAQTSGSSIDVSGILSNLSATQAAGVSICTAVLAMYFGFKIYKLLRQAG